VIAALEAPENRGKAVYHVSSLHPHRRANAIFLAACYAVACLHKTPEEAVAPFVRAWCGWLSDGSRVEAEPCAWLPVCVGSGPPIIAFRDASFGLCTYQLTVLDAVRGLHKAMAIGAFAYESYDDFCFLVVAGVPPSLHVPCMRRRFDIEAYERLELFRNGDMNWLIPGKFLAFSGPLDDPKPLPGGGYTFRPHDYVPIFKEIGVTMVVRLNKGHYDRSTFVENGIKHVDLYYPDGSVPSDDVLQEFLRVSPLSTVYKGCVGVVATARGLRHGAWAV
jgi:cell division cycle 14